MRYNFRVLALEPAVLNQSIGKVEPRAALIDGNSTTA